MTRGNLFIKISETDTRRWWEPTDKALAYACNTYGLDFEVMRDLLDRSTEVHIENLPEYCEWQAQQNKPAVPRPNTRAEYEPIFITFNRSTFAHETSTVTGISGVPGHGSGSTSGYDFLKAYDKAIEMAEKRGEIWGRAAALEELSIELGLKAVEVRNGNV